MKIKLNINNKSSDFEDSVVFYDNKDYIEEELAGEIVEKENNEPEITEEDPFDELDQEEQTDTKYLFGNIEKNLSIDLNASIINSVDNPINFDDMMTNIDEKIDNHSSGMIHSLLGVNPNDDEDIFSG